MLSDEEIFNQLCALPEHLKQQVVHYMEFLQAKYGQPTQKPPTTKRRPSPELVGTLTSEGDLMVPVAEVDRESAMDQETP